MKSLNDSIVQNKAPHIFSDEIMRWIKKEGFEKHKNDAYCYHKQEDEEYENECFFKHGGYYGRDWPIHIYIFSKGIGVDIDYECGGNSSNEFWNFSNYSFEEAYDNMVEYVNRWK